MQSLSGPLVVVAGNIAAGKSTAARLISQHYGWELLAEPAEDDEILRDFYSDMPRWTFTLNMHLLGVRAEQLHQAQATPVGAVADRSIYEDALFVDLARQLGTTTRRHADVFHRLLRVITASLPAPDLLVHLHAPTATLVERARRRGRPFATEVDPGYLDALQNLYTGWIDRYDLGAVLRYDVSTADLRTESGASEFLSAVHSTLARLES